MDIFPIYLRMKTQMFFFHLLKSEENTWVVFFFPFTEVWRQHMNVFSLVYLSLKTTHECFFFIYLRLKTTHGWFFFYLLKPEVNTWMFVLGIYLSLKKTHGYFSHLLKPEDNTFFFIYLSLKKTHVCFFSFYLLKSEDNTSMFVLPFA